MPLSIEYKPYEERANALLGTFGTTMQMLREVGAENLGVTMDFCHLLMAREDPAYVAFHLLRAGKLFSIHLNDGDGRYDSGLMAGTANPWKLLELLYYLKRYHYDGVIYFDTFPKNEDPAGELAANIAMVRRCSALLDEVGLSHIQAVTAQNDGLGAQRLLLEMLRDTAHRA